MKILLNRLAVGFLTIFLANLCSGQTNAPMRLSHFSGPPAYRDAAFKLMLAEANEYASLLNLPENLPIATNSLTEIFIASPYVAERFGAMGSLHTTNFSYGFGKGKHLSYITRLGEGKGNGPYDDNKQYAIKASAVDTNAAYLLATQYLAKAFVDVSRLTTSSIVSIEPWVILHMTTCKYTVEWRQGTVLINGVPMARPVVKVVVTAPKGELWTLRVEDPEYIVRKPLEIPNLEELLSQTNAPAETNVPAKKKNYPARAGPHYFNPSATAIR